MLSSQSIKRQHVNTCAAGANCTIDMFAINWLFDSIARMVVCYSAKWQTICGIKSGLRACGNWQMCRSCRRMNAHHGVTLVKRTRAHVTHASLVLPPPTKNGSMLCASVAYLGRPFIAQMFVFKKQCIWTNVLPSFALCFSPYFGNAYICQWQNVY